jgi:chaperonin GroES
MIKPEGYKVLVKPDPVEEKSDGGIILPDQVKDMEQRGVIRGIIIDIGPTANVKYIEDGSTYRKAKVGDHVIYARYGGFIIEEDDEEYRVLNDEDIIGLII